MKGYPMPLLPVLSVIKPAESTAWSSLGCFVETPLAIRSLDVMELCLLYAEVLLMTLRSGERGRKKSVSLRKSTHDRRGRKSGVSDEDDLEPLGKNMHPYKTKLDTKTAFDTLERQFSRF